VIETHEHNIVYFASGRVTSFEPTSGNTSVDMRGTARRKRELGSGRGRERDREREKREREREK
jgi:hypothetical protein